MSGLRLLRWRSASIVASLAVVGMMYFATGRGDHVIQIQFGTYPDLFEGTEVVIDGEPRGTLERVGARAMNGFRVEPGRHTVELRREGFASEPFQVDTESWGGTAMTFADVTERMGSDGQREEVLILY